MNEKQLYGIAFTQDGSTTAPVVGWKRDRETGEILSLGRTTLKHSKRVTSRAGRDM